MAALIDMSNQRPNIAYVGNTPWHNLGKNKEPGESLASWIDDAGLGHDVLGVPVQYIEAGEGGTEFLRTWAARQVLYRSDTKVPLSVVSDSYKIVQPREMIEFYEKLVAEGAFTLETAGSLAGGKRVWALAKANDGLVGIGEDKIAQYLLLCTSYDASLNTTIQQTSVRVVCNNTLSAAYGLGEHGREKTFKFSHQTEFKIDQVHAALALDETWGVFCDRVREFAEKKITRVEAAQFFGHVYYPQKDDEWFAEMPVACQKRIGEILWCYENGPGSELASATGTLWGALNAVTHHEDHLAPTRSANNRLNRAWFGEGNRIKARAWSQAKKIIAPPKEVAADATVASD